MSTGFDLRKGFFVTIPCFILKITLTEQATILAQAKITKLVVQTMVKSFVRLIRQS